MTRVRVWPMLALSAACASAEAPQGPRGAVLMQVGPGPDPWNDAAQCPLAPTLVGMPDDRVLPLSMSEYRSAPGSVRCSVHADGQRFLLSAQVTRDASTSLDVSGALDPTTSALDVAFTVGGDTFTSRAPCSADFTEESQMGVTSGAVWVTVTCPKVTDAFGATCFASAQFLVEGCER
jgi:hypothetical protein